MYKIRKKMTARILAAVLLLFPLSGCAHSHGIRPSQYRVVTGIEVVYQREAASFHRKYTSQEKMGKMLNYLRLLTPCDPPVIDPDRVPGHHVEITVSYSDGKQTVYRQKADQYLKTGSGPWRQVDRYRASQIGTLLLELPSDA